MKHSKVICRVIIGCGCFVFLSTFFPALYQPKYEVEERYADVTSVYQKVAVTLGYEETFFSQTVTLDDMKEKKDALEIRELIKDQIQQESQKSSYMLSESQIQQIAMELQGVYERNVNELEINDFLKQLRTISLVVILVAEVGMILVIKTTKRKQATS